jgi:hypothetical protein
MPFAGGGWLGTAIFRFFIKGLCLRIEAVWLLFLAFHPSEPPCFYTKSNGIRQFSSAVCSFIAVRCGKVQQSSAVYGKVRQCVAIRSCRLTGCTLAVCG